MAVKRSGVSRASRVGAGSTRRAMTPGLPGWFRRLQWAVGQRLSVRAKLTLWYAAMCALTLTLVGFGMKQALDYRTASTIDPNLKTSAVRVANALQRGVPSQPVRTPAEYAALVRRDPQLKHCSYAIIAYCNWLKQRLYDLSGQFDAPGVTEQVQVMAQNASAGAGPGGTGMSLPVLTPGRRPPVRLFSENNPLGMMLLVRDMAVSDRHFLTVHDKGETFRVYIMNLPPPPYLRGLGVESIVEVLQNEHTYIGVQRDLTIILLIGLPLGIVIALIAGWWIARAALRPIDRISRTVQAVGESRDLGRRVEFMGPEDEVGRLATTFDAMLGRLDRTFQTQRRFIADASHELRTPLTAIRGNADLMRIAPPGERDICLAAIRREAERMTRLVSDLLVLAEADVAEQPIHLLPVDLSATLTDVHRSTLLIADDRVEVLLERNDPVTVMADGDRVKQLILNLADNAVKFTPDGGAVSLSLRGEPDGARIEVSDSGIGIPAEEQAAIFERFYRVEEARSKRGSGLGLAICAWIVQAHGGSISVRSEPGKGSTFTVFLPQRLAVELDGETAARAAGLLTVPRT